VGGDQVSGNAAYTFAVTANRDAGRQLRAHRSQCADRDHKRQSGGWRCLSGAGNYADGSSVTVEAIPNPGYIFSKWKVGGATVSTVPSYTFTVSADVTLSASFTRIYSVTAESFPAAGGSTEMDSTSYKLDENARADAFPNAGYQFVNWTENGTVVSTEIPL